MTPHAANAVTALRVILTPLCMHTVLRATDAAPGWLAVPLFAIVVASDVIDGPLARAAGSASARGRAFDHGADITFILSVLGAYAYRGVVPWWVPGAIAAAFAVYVVDSLGRRAARPAARRIGHTGGVLNYVLIGVLVGNETLALRLLPERLLDALFALVPAYSGAAIAVRFLPARRLLSRRVTDRRDSVPPPPADPA